MNIGKPVILEDIVGISVTHLVSGSLFSTIWITTRTISDSVVWSVKHLVVNNIQNDYR